VIFTILIARMNKRIEVQAEKQREEMAEGNG